MTPDQIDRDSAQYSLFYKDQNTLWYYDFQWRQADFS